MQRVSVGWARKFYAFWLSLDREARARTLKGLTELGADAAPGGRWDLPLPGAAQRSLQKEEALGEDQNAY